MTNANIDSKTNSFDIHYIGWKYYKEIKKKAMEREFSWTGLVLGLSIAFFIVIITAFALKILYISFENTKLNDRQSFNTENIIYCGNINYNLV